MFLLKTNRKEVDQTVEIIMDPYSFPIVDYDGTKRWFDKERELHRIDGPSVICPDGTKYWYQHGKHHRIGGPACIYRDGCEKWYQNDELHCEDGPAIIFPSSGEKEYWIHGKQLSERDFKEYVSSESK